MQVASSTRTFCEEWLPNLPKKDPISSRLRHIPEQNLCGLTCHRYYHPVAAAQVTFCHGTGNSCEKLRKASGISSKWGSNSWRMTRWQAKAAKGAKGAKARKHGSLWSTKSSTLGMFKVLGSECRLTRFMITISSYFIYCISSRVFKCLQPVSTDFQIPNQLCQLRIWTQTQQIQTPFKAPPMAPPVRGAPPPTVPRWPHSPPVPRCHPLAAALSWSPAIPRTSPATGPRQGELIGELIVHENEEKHVWVIQHKYTTQIYNTIPWAWAWAACVILWPVSYIHNATWIFG